MIQEAEFEYYLGLVCDAAGSQGDVYEKLLAAFKKLQKERDDLLALTIGVGE